MAFARMMDGEAQRLDAGDWAALAQSYAASVLFEVEVTAEGTMLHMRPDLTHPAASAPRGRLTPSADLLFHMNELAARILVPESDASRSAGAGAGLTDND